MSARDPVFVATVVTRWTKVRAVADALMPLVVFLLFATTVALIVLVQSNDDNIDTLGDEVATLEDAVADVDQSTDRVETFVDDLEDETPTEAARNAAITAAVQLVPEIRDILCEAFPSATACTG